MKKTAFRCLAATLAFLLGIDSAAACRWMRSSGIACDPAPACVVPTCNACCPPVDPCGTAFPCGVETTVVAHSYTADCGCGSSTVVDGSMVHGSMVHGSMVHGSMVHEAPASSSQATYGASPTPTLATPPQVVEPAPAPAAFGDGFRSDNATVQSPAPDDAWDAGLDTPAEPAEEEAAFTPEQLPPAPAETQQPEPEVVADEPMFEDQPDELFGGEEAFGDAGFGEPEPEAMPNDDLFGAEPEPMPAEESEEDLFGGEDGLFGAEPETPADPAPMAEPMEPPAAEDDLFGAEPEDEPMPAEEDLFGGDDAFGDTPAADDNLFGAAPEADAMPAEPAEEDLFGGDDAFGEEPAAEGDLFGAEPEAEAAPAEMVPAEDDLFGGSDAFAEEPAAEDDLFGAEPEAMPADDAAPGEAAEDDLFDFGDDAGDDLFDTGPQDDGASDAAADLFDLGRVLQEPGGVQSGRDRTWVDDTGRFSTVGRLLAVDGASVRLAKPNGGVATVPLGRLSQSDLEFVSRQAMAMSQARDEAIAQGPRPDADAPKQAKAADAVAPLRTAQL